MKCKYCGRQIDAPTVGICSEQAFTDLVTRSNPVWNPEFKDGLYKFVRILEMTPAQAHHFIHSIRDCRTKAVESSLSYLTNPMILSKIYSYNYLIQVIRSTDVRMGKESASMEQLPRDI